MEKDTMASESASLDHAASEIVAIPEASKHKRLQPDSSIDCQEYHSSRKKIQTDKDKSEYHSEHEGSGSRLLQGESPARNARKTKTLRISSLPASATAESVKEWLGKENVLNKINCAPLDVLQLGLAPRGNSWAQATVTLKDLPFDIMKSCSELEGPNGSTVVIDDHFLGLTVLYQGPTGMEIKADIVAIHGLGGHALGSWKASVGHKVWLRDFLPVHIPNVRVMTYGYDTNLKKGDWKKTLESLAKTLLENLSSVRHSEATRPLIFITHSLGGLLIKQALVICAQQQQDYQPYKNILNNCLSLVFFAVPHHGMRFDRLRDITAGKGSAVLISDLLLDPDGEESPYLAHLNDAFVHAMRDRNADILHYYENRRTDASLNELHTTGRGQKIQIDHLMVTKISASYTGLEKPCHVLSLDGDHRSLIKFQTEMECETVIFRIKQFLQRVQSKSIKTNQRSERGFTEDEKLLLKSLSFPEMDRRFKDVAVAENSTCRWLNSHSSYQTWIQARSSLLWIKGHPGSGKSTLLKHAISQENQVNTFVASFFFNGRGSPLEKSPAGLYRALLHKLLQFAPEKHDEIARVYKNRCDTQGEFEKQWSWHENELEVWLGDLLLSLSIHPLSIYVDAIDEAGKEIAVKLVIYFQKIVSKAIESGGSLKVCLSCRHYPLLPGIISLQLNVEHENKADIAEYSRTGFASGGLSDEKTQILERAIIEKANGIFQWAVIVVPRMIDLFRIGTKLQRIQEVIKRLPEELDELYREIVQTIPNDERHHSLRLIQWICCAMRPLSMDELRYAIVVDKNVAYSSLSACREDGDFVESNADMENRIKHFSRGLAEVKRHSELNWIQFIHQSVQDYFVTSGLQLINDQSLAVSISQMHFQLAWSCVRYIEMEEISLAERDAHTPETARYRRLNEAKFNEQLARSYPFAEYAALSWPLHAAQAELDVPSTEFLELFDLFSRPHPMENWIFLFKCTSSLNKMKYFHPLGTTVLHIMASYGLSKAMSDYLHQHDFKADYCDSYGYTPLSQAAKYGHEKIVQLLVDRKDVTADRQDTYMRQTPLSHAAGSGHLNIVQLLVSRSDVNADSKDRHGLTPFSHASRHGMKSVVQLLMERKDVIVNSQSHEGWTPLLYAADSGQAEVVKLLLGRKEVNPDFISTSIHLTTPLLSAANRGHKEVVQLLLDCKNVNADYIDNKGRTPISYAASSGHKDIIQLLIQYGHVKVDKEDFNDRTPLSYAAEFGYKEVVEFLASRHDVDLDSRDKSGRTPLSWAAGKGKEDVVQLLVLLAGVDKDSKDSRGRTPLSYAAAENHIGVIQVLLRTEHVDINSADIDGRTPLAYAARAYYEESALYLLESRDIEADRPGNWGRTPLSWTTNDKVVRKLIARKDVLINSKDIRGMTPLMHAVYWGRRAGIQQLLEHDDTDVNSRAKNGETALSYAISGGGVATVAVVQQLLDCSKVQPDTRDEEGRTPLSYAAERGLIEVVRLLLRSKNVRIGSKDKYGRTAYSYAAEGRFEDVMNLLEVGRE